MTCKRNFGDLETRSKFREKNFKIAKIVAKIETKTDGGRDVRPKRHCKQLL